MSRATARAAAMQMIFEKVSGGQGGEETLQLVYEELRQDGAPGTDRVRDGEPKEEDRQYIARALEGTIEHLDEIDSMISSAAIGWSLDQMSLVDLTILRLACWELLYEEDMPSSVAISEALELTERYSDPADKSFVNGILGTIFREHRK